MYKCECGKEFDLPNKFNAHKSHCQIHHQFLGKNYSMQERVEKQQRTLIENHGSIENYRQQHSQKIKAAFINRTDTFDYIISTIDKDTFIKDYIIDNHSRSYMREKYNISSDYMMDRIVNAFDCKKSAQARAKLMTQTKDLIYDVDNRNNWRKGHETRIQNSGSLENSYSAALIKQQSTCLERYGTKCTFNLEYLSTHPHKKNSSPNLKFAKLLDEYHIKYEQEFVIDLKSYDFRIENILVEINPTITHNSEFIPYPPYRGLHKDYHKNKRELAETHGYRCIHVWDWDNMSQIITLLQSREKLYARKCNVKVIPSDIAAEFCNQYHLQGHARAKIYLGLYLDSDLVSIMSFGTPRYNKNFEWELIRYCSNRDVIGGAEKLFSCFISHYCPKTIVSYCDRNKFSGQVYTKLGFTFDNLAISCHWYNMKTKDHILDSTLRQRGFDQLLGNKYEYYGKGTSNAQLMLQHGYLPVQDSGQARYIWINKEVS